MAKRDEAEEMLKRCPSLKDLRSKSGNPRLSSEIVSLTPIRLRQGRLDEAVRLATKVLGFRQKLLGNRLEIRGLLNDIASFVHLQSDCYCDVRQLCL